MNRGRASGAGGLLSLREHVRRAYILAFREDVSSLVTALEVEGLECEIVRGPSQLEKPHWSRAFKCLASHTELWRRLAGQAELSMVCEADFVPVSGMGDLPLPCPLPSDGDDARIAWLYSPGSILYGIDPYGFTYGHANSAVCYVLNGSCASRCVDFLDDEIERMKDDVYAMWDSRLGVHLRWKKGVLNFFVVNQYGEHGGHPNPEHEQRAFRGWHQAYRLAGRLSFLPAYARGSRLRFFAFRFRARARGIARILTGRFYHPAHIDAGQSRGRLAATVLSALAGGRAAERQRIESALASYVRGSGAPAAD